MILGQMAYLTRHVDDCPACAELDQGWGGRSRENNTWRKSFEPAPAIYIILQYL